jgi:hypothetical protein
MDITSSKTASWDGLKPGPLGYPGVKLGPHLFHGRRQCAVSHSHLPLPPGEVPLPSSPALVLGVDPSSQVALKTSSCTISHGDEGVGDIGQSTDR